MKMLWLKKLVVLGSLFLFSFCKYNSENIDITKSNNLEVVKTQENDTLKIVNQLKMDIEKLLASNSLERIDQTIFGDCIYFYTKKNENEKIEPADILKEFDEIFDNEFINHYQQKLSKENYEYLHFERINSSKHSEKIDFDRLENVLCSFTIPIPESEYDSSRIYWFRFDGEKWIFTGLTCTG